MAQRNGAPRDGIGGEARRTVATYSNYAQAERAVDYLSDQGFPVERVAIVARDLDLVEQVTGRRGYLEAALQGAASGGLIGLLIGWLFGVFNWFNPTVSAFWLAIDGLWFGAVVGLVFALILQALTRGRRDFNSIAGLTADHYDVMVDDAFAAEAVRLLAQLESPPAPTPGAGGPETARARAER
jgi:uncharacterized membrane protein